METDILQITATDALNLMVQDLVMWWVHDLPTLTPLQIIRLETLLTLERHQIRLYEFIHQVVLNLMEQQEVQLDQAHQVILRAQIQHDQILIRNLLVLSLPIRAEEEVVVQVALAVAEEEALVAEEDN